MDFYQTLNKRIYGYKSNLIAKEINKNLRKLNLSNVCMFQMYHTLKINCVDIDIIKGQYLISCAESGEIGIFNISNFEIRLNGDKQVFVYSKWKHAINIVQWYPNDTGIFTSSSYSHGLHVWDTNNLKKVENFSFEHPLYHHHMSPQPLQPLIAVASDKVYLVDLLVGSHVQSLPNASNKNIDIVKWSNVESYILTSVKDNTLLLWDIRQPNSQLGKIDIPIQKVKLNKSRPIAIQGLEYSPDGLSVALYLNESSLYIYDVKHLTKDPIILNPYQAPPVSFPQIPMSGRRWVTKFVYGTDLITIPSQNQIKIVEIDGKKCSKPYTVPALHFGDITNVVANPKNPGCLYTSSLDTSIVEWSIYNKFDDNFA